ncbi:hypothetical protein ACLOJK_037733 [Asimina triloba]
MRWALFHPCLISPEPSKIRREIEKTLRADGVLFLFLSHALSRALFHLPNLRPVTSLSRTLFHPLPRWSEVHQNTALCRTLPILSLTASLVISFFPVLHLFSRPPSDTTFFFSTSIIALCFFRSLLPSSQPPFVAILGVRILGSGLSIAPFQATATLFTALRTFS